MHFQCILYLIRFLRWIILLLVVICGEEGEDFIGKFLRLFRFAQQPKELKTDNEHLFVLYFSCGNSATIKFVHFHYPDVPAY